MDLPPGAGRSVCLVGDCGWRRSDCTSGCIPTARPSGHDAPGKRGRIRYLVVSDGGVEDPRVCAVVGGHDCAYRCALLGGPDHPARAEPACVPAEHGTPSVSVRRSSDSPGYHLVAQHGSNVPVRRRSVRTMSGRAEVVGGPRYTLRSVAAEPSHPHSTVGVGNRRSSADAETARGVVRLPGDSSVAWSSAAASPSGWSALAPTTRPVGRLYSWEPARVCGKPRVRTAGALAATFSKAPAGPLRTDAGLTPTRR